MAPVEQLVTETLARLAPGSQGSGSPEMIVASSALNASSVAQASKLAKSVWFLDWTDGGFLFSQHPPKRPPNADTDVRAFLRAMMLRSGLVIAVADDETSADEVRRNAVDSCAQSELLLCVVSLDTGSLNFLRIGSTTAAIDRTDWLVAAERIASLYTPSVSPGWSAVRNFFPWSLSLALGERFASIVPPAGLTLSTISLCDEATEKLEAHDSDLLKDVLNHAVKVFLWLDEDGKGNANSYRSFCVLIPCLIAASTMTAVVAHLSHANHFHWHVAEAVLLLTAALLFWQQRRRQYHELWIRSRLIAEFMRTVGLQHLLNQPLHFSGPQNDNKMWTSCLVDYWTFVRTIELSELTTVPDAIRSSQRSALNSFLRGQALWHSTFASQHERAHKKLSTWSLRLFFVTFLACSAQILGALLSFGNPEALLVCTLLAASAAFICGIVSNQLGFQLIAQRSEFAERRYLDLLADLERLGPIAPPRSLIELANRAFAVYTDEQRSWFVQTSSLSLHL